MKYADFSPDECVSVNKCLEPSHQSRKCASRTVCIDRIDAWGASSSANVRQRERRKTTINVIAKLIMQCNLEKERKMVAHTCLSRRIKMTVRTRRRTKMTEAPHTVTSSHTLSLASVQTDGDETEKNHLHFLP